MLRIFKIYYPIRNTLFVFSEGAFIFLSVVISSHIFLDNGYIWLDYRLFLKSLLITIVCQICLFYNDLYNLKTTDTFFELLIRLLQALGAAAIILALIYFFIPGLIIAKGIFHFSIAIVMLLIVSWRFGYAKVLNRGLFNRKIMLLGSNPISAKIFSKIIEKKDCGYTVSAVISKNEWKDETQCKNVDFIRLKTYDQICDIAYQAGIEIIVVALREKRGNFPARELLQCRFKGIEILEGHTFYEMLTGKFTVESINPSWLIYSHGFQNSKLQRILKRAIDLVLSLTMSIILLPFFIAVSIIIKLDSKGPVFFSQERIGENRKPYRIHKFRSMRSDAEKEIGPVWTQENDDRITRVGTFIRKWRIDELPQLWNIIKGEMSFVGPRPERAYFIEQLEENIPYYSERFSVKPGLTGWAQVCYGYGACVEDAIEKLNYELFYIKNMCTTMDMMILARTLRTVIFGHGR